MYSEARVTINAEMRSRVIKQPIDRAGDAADAQRYGNGDGSVHLAQPDQIIRDDAGEQQDRPDRKIDAAADDDECFSNCEDAQDREIAQRVAKVVHRREARRSDGKQDNQRNQRDPETLGSRSADRGLKAIGK